MPKLPTSWQADGVLRLLESLGGRNGWKAHHRVHLCDFNSVHASATQHQPLAASRCSGTGRTCSPRKRQGTQMPTSQCASSSCLWTQLLRSILQDMVGRGLRRLELFLNFPSSSEALCQLVIVFKVIASMAGGLSDVLVDRHIAGLVKHSTDTLQARSRLRLGPGRAVLWLLCAGWPGAGRRRPRAWLAGESTVESQSLSSAVSEARGADPSGGYKFGDLTRGAECLRRAAFHMAAFDYEACFPWGKRVSRRARSLWSFTRSHCRKARHSGT